METETKLTKDEPKACHKCKIKTCEGDTIVKPIITADGEAEGLGKEGEDLPDKENYSYEELKDLEDDGQIEYVDAYFLCDKCLENQIR